ncbi:MAG: DUF1028 domain-containing protein [Xanthobacteraceae bacterium]|nr:DUF1028 domain-containing protein [Xanthobacteraceae bacterium]
MELRPLAMSLLASGHTAASAPDVVMQSDPLREFRQIGILGREGRAAVLRVLPPELIRGIGRTGKNFAVFGNVLASEEVLVAMAAAFEASAEELPARTARPFA